MVNTPDTLFAYGTLQHPRVITHVIGRMPPASPGRLHDYLRLRVRDQPFPGILPRPGALTDGTLFYHITPAEWRKLDAYEADFYERRTVQVHSATGEPCPALAYVVPPPHQHALTNELWDLNTYRPGPDAGIP